MSVGGRTRLVPKPGPGKGPILNLIRDFFESIVGKVVLGLPGMMDLVKMSMEELKRDIKDNACLYMVGGGAIHTYVKDNGLERNSVKGTPNNRIEEALKEALEDPKDYDFKVVIPTGVPKCNAKECRDHDVVERVIYHLKSLLRSMHNNLKNNWTSTISEKIVHALNFSEDNNILKGKIVEAVRFFDASDIDLSTEDEDKVRMELGDEGTGKACNANEMNELADGKLGKCNPFRNSFNTSISFKTMFDTKELVNDFVLARIALMLYITYTDGTISRCAINLVDVSIPRSDDNIYKTGPFDVTKIMPTSGLVPKIGYMFDDVMKQYKSRLMLKVDGEDLKTERLLNRMHLLWYYMSQQMSQQGIPTNSKIAVKLANQVEWLAINKTTNKTTNTNEIRQAIIKEWTNWGEENFDQLTDIPYIPPSRNTRAPPLVSNNYSIPTPRPISVAAGGAAKGKKRQPSKTKKPAK